MSAGRLNSYGSGTVLSTVPHWISWSCNCLNWGLDKVPFNLNHFVNRVDMSLVVTILHFLSSRMHCNLCQRCSLNLLIILSWSIDSSGHRMPKFRLYFLCQIVFKLTQNFEILTKNDILPLDDIFILLATEHWIHNKTPGLCLKLLCICAEISPLRQIHIIYDKMFISLTPGIWTVREFPLHMQVYSYSKRNTSHGWTLQKASTNTGSGFTTEKITLVMTLPGVNIIAKVMKRNRDSGGEE